MVELGIAIKCPSCDTTLSHEGRSVGLCPSCLLELALDDTSLEAAAWVEPGEAPTLQFTPDLTLSEGQIQGDRYRIRSLLGRGGMGEVWRAYDLKLRQDVALKALRKELVSERQALETLRQEVRIAREVVSPNVCRVFDLEEIDGQELVSMEYVDGTTLQEILRERGPLDLKEALEIASQLLAGLEAIHEAGLVHRDIKPENLMITRTGRVVVMDFGIAKGLGEGGGLVAGTPAYMSPEHSKGTELDARADLFSAGVVLAEMVEPGGTHRFEDRQRVWEGIHQKKRRISETPWSKVIAQAVSAETQDRYTSASALARALEEVTLRAASDETARPYPGLSAFQEEDAEFFYGRELEVEALWKKLRRPHLLAVIGPSGAGKSSFLRAGLLPTLPAGWRAIITTPGSRPFDHLARALAEQLSGDPATLDALLRFEDPDVAASLISQWRQECRYGLIILDQFEELFTQNPEEVQSSFAELLGALPLNTDVHVLLSLRDDFLFHCSNLESLAPVFSELSPLKTLSGASLRRALVKPALKYGYRFENEGTVEEMLSEVEGQQGALPLLAFTAAQLWERRDRETGLLTHKSYQKIGGVGGALAQHAEAILDYIGESNTPIVRELFRNLVTAQGTRAARDREELFSVFSIAEGEPFLEPSRVLPTTTPPPRRPAAKHVLNSLIDARLLTSYEIPAHEEGGEPHHRIEIVHESLLTRWPRLVRWQRQDADGAQLRDELRHQARLWNEKGRPQDLLWTGTSFQEFQLWRQRYPGGLTAVEEEFGQAMTAHSERRKRRQRLAVTATVLLSLLVALVTGGLWLRSERSERLAREETRRAEASKLLALGQLRQEEDPTEALAYTTASLELADSDEARRYMMALLWEEPPAFEMEPGGPQNRWPTFSPDGTRLALAGASAEVRVWTNEGTVPPLVLPGHLVTTQGPNKAFWASNEMLVTGNNVQDEVRLWSIPEGKVLREIDLGGSGLWQLFGTDLFRQVEETEPSSGHQIYKLRSWRLPDGEPQELGQIDWTEIGGNWGGFTYGGDGWIYGKGNSVFYRPLPVRENVPDRLVGSHENEARSSGTPTEPDHYWTRDGTTGEMRRWDLTQEKPTLTRVIPPLENAPEGRFPDPTGRWAIHEFSDAIDRQVPVWDLEAWPAARPLTLKRSGSWFGAYYAFHPRGDWLVVSTRAQKRLTFWPLRSRWQSVVDGYSKPWRPLAFSPDGRWLATSWADDTLRLWPLQGSGSDELRTLVVPEESVWMSFVFDPRSRFLVAVGWGVYIVPLDGSPPRKLEGFSGEAVPMVAAVSPSGLRVATAFGWGKGPKTLRVWDLETGELRLFNLPESTSLAKTATAGGVWNLEFTDESTLYTAGDGGVRRWNLESGTHEPVFPTEPEQGIDMVLGPGGRTALVSERRVKDYLPVGPAKVLDVATGVARNLPAFGGSPNGLGPIAFDSSGTVVATGDMEGIVRVGRLSEDQPHLLVGHEGPVAWVAISPDGRWVASAGDDSTLRLWPMPDLDKPPLHTLPHDELIAKLESLTNIRAARDPGSPEGWTFTLDPFPGWKEVPTWQ